MTTESKTAAEVKLHKDVKQAIIQAMQELDSKQQLTGSWVPGYDELVKLINSVSSTVQSTSKRVVKVEHNMVDMVEKFNPAIPVMVGVKDIEEMIKFTQQSIMPSKIYKTITDLSEIQGNLKASKDLPLTALFQALETLIANLEKVLSNYTPEFFNSLMSEVNSGLDNAIKITDVLEDFLNGTYGIKIPATMDVAGVTMTLNTLNAQLANINIQDLDKDVQKEWKPVKIGLMCVLDLIKDILGLLKDVAPLTIRLGAAGGVAAGVNATAKASASVISLGSLTWGTAATLVSMLKTLINTGDAYIDLRISQRKAEAA